MGKFDPAPTLAAGLLRLARDKAHMTQAELASNAGISQQAVSAYETGRKEPTLPTLQRLLAAAGLEMRIRLEPIDDHDATFDPQLKWPFWIGTGGCFPSESVAIFIGMRTLGHG